MQDQSERVFRAKTAGPELLLQHHLEHAHGIKASVKSISVAIERLGLRLETAPA